MAGNSDVESWQESEVASECDSVLTIDSPCNGDSSEGAFDELLKPVRSETPVRPPPISSPSPKPPSPANQKQRKPLKNVKEPAMDRAGVLALLAKASGTKLCVVQKLDVASRYCVGETPAEINQSLISRGLPTVTRSQVYHYVNIMGELVTAAVVNPNALNLTGAGCPKKLSPDDEDLIVAEVQKASDGTKKKIAEQIG